MTITSWIDALERVNMRALRAQDDAREAAQHSSDRALSAWLRVHAALLARIRESEEVELGSK